MTLKSFRNVAFAAIVFGLGFSSQAQILYKVEKAGSDKVSYLLGTHHFAPLAVVDSIAELPAIINGVDRMYGEIDMSSMTDPATIMAMQQKVMAPADSTLDKVLTPAQLEAVSAVWNEYTQGAMPLEAMYMMKPSLISTQLASLMAMKVFPQLNPMEGIDMTMQTRSREAGKPVGGLETMDFQLDMLYSRPIAEQAEGLMKTVEDIKGEEARAVELSNAYLNHNIDEILKLMLVAEDEDQEAVDRMIYSRNDNWVKQLSKEMPAESLFVVVGAGHLPGDRGVIKGLRDAGFTVTPVK